MQIKHKKITDIFAVAVLLCYIIILLYVLLFESNVARIWLPALLCCVWLILMFTAIVQKNGVSLWLSFLVFIPFLIEILVYNGFDYNKIYPLYIAAPGFGFLTLAATGKHLKLRLGGAALFMIPSAVFGLHSSGICSVGISVFFTVLFLIFFTIIVFKEKIR